MNQTNVILIAVLCVAVATAAVPGMVPEAEAERPQVESMVITPVGFTVHTNTVLPDSDGVLHYHIHPSQSTAGMHITFAMSDSVDKAVFNGETLDGNPLGFTQILIETGCNYFPLEITKGDDTWTVHVLISHRPSNLKPFPACDTLPGELTLTGVRVETDRLEHILPPASGLEITDYKISVAATGQNIPVTMTLYAPPNTDIRFDGKTGRESVEKSFTLDQGCHKFDVWVTHNNWSALKELYVMISPDGSGACPTVNYHVDAGGDDVGDGNGGGNGNGGQTGGQTGGQIGGTGGGSGGGGGFFIPPTFFAPSAQSEPEPEPEPEPLPILNGTIPNIRMISIPHMDMWNGTTITPFQCNVTGGGTIQLSPMYDGMDLVRGTFEMLDISAGNVTQIMAGAHTPMNGTATYNVTAHVTATYNVTQIPPHSVLLDVHAGGYEWRISEGTLATFQDIFGTVDVLQRYQYGSIEWTVQGGSCQMPQTP